MTGANWIFLRGLARESAHWGDFPERFAQALPGARVHMIDLPGNGERWRENSPLSLASMTESVREQALRQTERPAPRFLFAVSLGGMIAFDWLSRRPEEIAGAVLVNASLRGISPLHRRLRWRVWPDMFAIATRRDAPARERAILALTSQAPIEETRVEAHARAYRLHPIAHANLARQLWAAATHRPPAAAPATPVLLLNSLGDRMVDPACSRDIAQHFRLPLKTHPWAGHDLPLDDPGWTIRATAEWLKII
jgi:pimeloyl-ACP methyl ester carboxylesterase